MLTVALICLITTDDVAISEVVRIVFLFCVSMARRCQSVAPSEICKTAEVLGLRLVLIVRRAEGASSSLLSLSEMCTDRRDAVTRQAGF